MSEAIWVVVLKGFEAEGVHLVPGDMVDASDWRLRDSLIKQRRIRPASAQELAALEAEDAANAQKLKARARTKKR